MFHLSLYFAFFAAFVSATSRCETVERGVQGFEAKFFNYEWRDEVGWEPGFFQNGGYNKGEVLHTVTGVKRINFDFCADSHDIRYGQIYGQETTISNYTIELTGYFTPTSTGDHKFYVQADNGVSLHISRGLSCCNSPNGGAYGDYELQSFGYGQGEGTEKKNTFYLEDGVRYFIKIVTFNWLGSGSLKVRLITPNNEQAGEIGNLVFQDTYNTNPCPDSTSDLPESSVTVNENEKKTECSSCAEIATASNGFESTLAESGISAVKSSKEISGALSTTAKLSTQSLEPEVSTDCESCLSNLGARPTDVGFEKTSGESTSVVNSECIDIELALHGVFSTSDKGTTSLEHSAEFDPGTLVSSSTDKVSLKTKENSKKGKEESNKTQDPPNEKVAATTSTQRVSDSEPSVSPVSGSISPGSVHKSVDTSVDAMVVQKTSESKVSGAVSASAAFPGKVLIKSSSEVAVPSSESIRMSHVESSQPEATTSSGQRVSHTKESADHVTITSCTGDCTVETSTSCTEDCKVETSTTYVTMTTTNESGKTVTVTYCPSTEQASPSDICIAGDAVCLSYAASVNVYPTPALVHSSKAKPSAAVSETKENKVMETATTCTEDCKVETSTTYVTMTTTNESGKTVTVTYCPSTEQASPSNICIAGDAVCLSYAASVNVYPTPALVHSSKAKPSAAVSETKENKVMETATTCTEDCKVETSTTYVTMTTTNESGKTVTVTYCPSTEQASPSNICIAGDAVCLSYAASVNVYPTPALVHSSKAKPSAAVSETKENKVMETATTCTEDCKVETSTTYVTMTTTNESGKTVTVTYCPSTEQASPSNICIAGDAVCLSYAASVNVYPTPALVHSSKAKPSAAVSETKENKVMETATTCTEDCKVETSTTYVTMTTTNESGKTVTVTYCPSTEQASPSNICIAGDAVCLSYAASVNVYPTPALVANSKAVELKPSAAVSETKETQVMETTKNSKETVTTCTVNCPVETSTTYVTMTTTNENGKTVTVTYCPSTDQAQPSDICIAGDSVCLSYAASVNVYPTTVLVANSKAVEPKLSAAISEAKENQVMKTAKKTDESNLPPRSSNTAANLQPAQSVESGSPARVISSGNSKETTPAKKTFRYTPEDTVSVTVTSTTRSKAGPNSAVPMANSIENGASPIGAFASLNILASLAVALISLLVFA